MTDVGQYGTSKYLYKVHFTSTTVTTNTNKRATNQTNEFIYSIFQSTITTLTPTITITTTTTTTLPKFTTTTTTIINYTTNNKNRQMQKQAGS